MSGYTGPTLETYVETRLNLLIEQLKAIENRLDEKIKEADIRYEQRFRAQMEAISKSDIASEKRFEGVNEFRKALTDQTQTFVPRVESNQRTDALEVRLNKVEAIGEVRAAKVIGAEENRAGSKSDVKDWISIIMMLVGVGTLALSFLKKG